MAGPIPNRFGSAERTGRTQPPRLRRIILTAILVLPIIAMAVFGRALYAKYEDSRLQKMSAADLDTVVKKDPKNTQALYRLGLALVRDNRYREATNAFLTVLEREPVRPDVLNDLGLTYLAQERYYESLIAFNGALAARPDYPAAYGNLGRLHLATKMPFTAVRELEHAVRYAPSDVSAICDLGEAYQKTLNLQAAKRSYQAAIRLNPRYLSAYVGLGQTEYGLAEYAAAGKTLNQALALAPDDTQTLLTLARMRMDEASSEAELGAVQKLLDRAARVDPDNAEVWYDRGRVALRQHQAGKAVEYLTRTLQMSPRHDAALHQLERALRAAGRSADANRAGKVFQEHALREREETHLEEVVSHHPQDWDSQARLVDIYLQSGQRGLALLVFRRILAAAPRHPALPQLRLELDRHFASSSATSSEVKGP